ncbi:hypothetical protein ASG49_10940 [Marmoricola sp. Leaf446]|uniref:hypothetical protein n=1 Tax=Marmoricola sp. Leaf446 TaxID=1736379 RepID=UPI0006F3E4EE|nr:hypothetical protein [Marmoricola sp. Leaf446]KQT91531.1 hypothetical protein ASG49_10940 [Marmoricola sp. Leaf446]
MTSSELPVEPEPVEPDPVDRVADAVVRVPGVTGLHAGSYGEVATYLPGRRVAGVRQRDGITEVHVTVAMGTAILEAATQVRTAVEAVTGDEVHVVVEDVSPA